MCDSAALRVSMAKTRAKKKTKTVPVTLSTGQKLVIIPAKPKSADIPKPFLKTWMHECQSIPEDHWPIGIKVHEPHIVTYGEHSWSEDRCTCKQDSIKISDMHTMRLVNSIKWCVRMAAAYLSNNIWNDFGHSQADILAQSPQWRNLLSEAKKRHLNMLNGPWYGEAMKAIAFRDM